MERAKVTKKKGSQDGSHKNMFFINSLRNSKSFKRNNLRTKERLKTFFCHLFTFTFKVSRAARVSQQAPPVPCLTLVVYNSLPGAETLKLR